MRVSDNLEVLVFHFPSFIRPLNVEEVSLIKKFVILKDYERNVKYLRVFITNCLVLTENFESFSFYADFVWRLLVFLCSWIEGDFLSMFLKLSLVDIMPNRQNKIFTNEEASPIGVNLFICINNLTA